jgi:hypothetical protein
MHVQSCDREHWRDLYSHDRNDWNYGKPASIARPDTRSLAAGCRDDIRWRQTSESEDAAFASRGGDLDSVGLTGVRRRWATELHR